MIDIITLKTTYVKVLITNIGASLMSVQTPDRYGIVENIILGYADAADYLTDPYYLGATVGRVAGRIRGINLGAQNQIFRLAGNDVSGNHLHGGFEGFNHKIFEIVNCLNDKDTAAVDLYYHSINGEEGYPGNLKLKVSYSLSGNILSITHKAETDQITPVNLTNHSYFNLTGDRKKATLQQLLINADEVLETDNNYIPTGKIFDIRGTRHDFNQSKSICHERREIFTPRFNDYFILKKDLTPDAIIYDQISGRRLEIKTSYPGIQFYSGDFLSTPFNACEGICLEAQHYPDAINHSNFPSILLHPSNTYQNFIQYVFSTE